MNYVFLVYVPMNQLIRVTAQERSVITHYVIPGLSRAPHAEQKGVVLMKGVIQKLLSP